MGENSGYVLTKASDFIKDNLSGDLVVSGDVTGKLGEGVQYRLQSGLTYRLSKAEVQVLQRLQYKPRWALPRQSTKDSL